MTIVYTAGVFDLLHRGHLNIIQKSKEMGDLLVVGVVSDEGCYAYKGIRPNDHESDRLDAIRRLPWVDVAVMQRGTDPSFNLRRFLPAIFTHADDWSRLKQGHETLEELGIEYVTVPYTPNVSSTQLRKALNG